MDAKSTNATLVAALRQLAIDIESPDGVPESVITEAANRIEELGDYIMSLYAAFENKG
jgi:hypothetical protein